MFILDVLKYAKVAWSDKSQVETLVAQAKVMEGPKASWKTGEFWFNQVLPILGGMIGSAAALVSAPALVPYFVIGTTIVATVTYLGRQWLKSQHLKLGQALDLSNPEVMAQFTDIIKNVSSAVNAIKDAKGGNLDAAKSITDTLNAPVTVNVAAK